MELILTEETPAPNGDFLGILRKELDGYYETIVQFPEMEPDQVLLAVSGISARLVYIRAQLLRSGAMKAQKLRTSEIEPLIEHLERQFRVHSRLISMRQLDFQLSGGQV
jgi:hypothetical protein